MTYPSLRRFLHKRMVFPFPTLISLWPYGICIGEALLLTTFVALQSYWFWYWSIGWTYRRKTGHTPTLSIYPLSYTLPIYPFHHTPSPSTPLTLTPSTPLITHTLSSHTPSQPTPRITHPLQLPHSLTPSDHTHPLIPPLLNTPSHHTPSHHTPSHHPPLSQHSLSPLPLTHTLSTSPLNTPSHPLFQQHARGGGIVNGMSPPRLVNGMEEEMPVVYNNPIYEQIRRR